MAAVSLDDPVGEPEPFRRARRILGRARELPAEGDSSLACELAEALWDAARQLETPAERRQRLRMARLVSDAAAQRFAVGLTDRTSRRAPPERTLAAVEGLCAGLGVPEALEGWERFGMKLLPHLGAVAPAAAAKAVDLAVAREAGAYVVRGSERLEALLGLQAKSELCINLNHLGEEVVGEQQAERHARRYLELVRRPDVTTLSLKISALFSQTSLLAFDQSLAVLAERLRPIYRAALEATPQKLVVLDMEAYRDLELTLTLFMRLLDEPELTGLRAGVVLQAYLPDSVVWQKRLIEWAKERCARGGVPVRMRLVKGANLGLERVESSLRGWPVPTLPNKAEVDAQFKHMLRTGCRDGSIDCVHVGVGSHNLFDVAYALILRERCPTPEHIQVEMLHGMAEPLRRAVRRVSGDVLVYLPAVEPQDFPTAVAYLMRRFDESAAEENFLRHGFSMATGDRAFAAQRERFQRSFSAYVARPSFRADVRSASEAPRQPSGDARFVNEPDTDPSRRGDRAFLLECLKLESPLERVPLSIGDTERFEGPTEAGFDPSRPGVVPYQWRSATEHEVEEALSEAARGAQHWTAVSAEERIASLRAAAEELRASRQQLIWAMVLDGGKRVEEADSEVSEAIDFAEYYASSFEALHRAYETRPRGVVVVTPPWNFPLAIPLGGVLAALVAGNAVILKPASETPLVAYLGASALWRAGIPRSALQLVSCHESVGSRLVTDPRVAAVVLTGATETARLFRRMRPDLHLIAETGGKNALIVSTLCDRELAIRDAVRSAFGHAGQKCSALGLLIVERDLYESPDFRRQLKDAAASLPVGSAWDPRSMVTPLIRPPGGALARGLELEAGDSWLLEPVQSSENPRLLSPGIKLGVRPGSHCHRAELFGPVLAVLPADDLRHALHLANATPYGLTAGFHGLDEQEQAAFVEHMQAGNLYVNRTITGAIVGRQPFGGHKASSFGPGAKAGGPNYVQQLCFVEARRAARGLGELERLGARSPAATQPTPKLEPAPKGLATRLWRALGRLERTRLEARWSDYLKVLGSMAHPELLQPHLVGEANWFRYRAKRVAVVVNQRADWVDLASLLGVRHALPALELHVVGPLRFWWLESLVLQEGARHWQDLGELARGWGADPPRRLRLLGVDASDAWAVFGGTDIHIDAEPVSDFGRVEILRYAVEQSVSITQHRHGNLNLADLLPRPPGLR